MGIPSYFSYIVHNHRKILKRLNKGSISVNNLYIDSNSLIYDSIYEILEQYKDNKTFENLLINNVCNKIEDYITILNPDDTVIIAFDGVAPVAKLEQQRTRRYKSQFIETVNMKLNPEKEKLPWNKTAITPGTAFMDKLNKDVALYFQINKGKLPCKNIIVSGSDIAGEGEHKIFEYIRSNSIRHKDQKSVIHGLDADLIMLCLNHLHISRNIHLYRETPHFIKNISSDLDPDETYLINIHELADNIANDLTGNKNLSDDKKLQIVHDYIFVCLFLGNDFMPHFPCMNIRTTGIEILLGAYKNICGSKGKFLLQENKIIWKNVREFISYLSQDENLYLREEYKARNKMEKRYIPNRSPEEKVNYFNLVPIKEREIEKYINPFESHWEERYYKMLFDIEITDERRKQISINFLEALEWNISYYTRGCKDWNWCYKYHYPPLLKDLSKFVPYFDTEFVECKQKNPVSSYTQLAYVLPRNSLDLLPFSIRQKLLIDYSEWYQLDFRFKWSFCKYFWESHIDMPEIDIEKIKLITEIK